MNNPIPNKTIIVYTGNNILSNDANITDEIIEKSLLLKKYGTTNYINNTNSPLRNGSNSPRKKIPINNKIIEYYTDLNNKNYYINKNKLEIKNITTTTTTTTDLMTNTTISITESSNKILKPSDIIISTTELDTISSNENSDNSDNESIESNKNDEQLEQDIEKKEINLIDWEIDKGNKISRVSWLLYVESNRANGIVDEKLFNYFNYLVQLYKSQLNTEIITSMREDTLPVSYLNDLVRY